MPLAEAREAYRVTVEVGSTVLRIADTEDPAFEYTNEMQAEDGSPSTIRISVAQLSNTYGYGTERVIETNV